MRRLPIRSNLDHLKKQAKELLKLYKAQDRAAVQRIRSALPAAAGKSDAQAALLGLRLHDAQSCIAREYGFPSWTDLKDYVSASRDGWEVGAVRLERWLSLVYPGDVSGTMNPARPAVAARLLKEVPEIAQQDASVSCATGDEGALRAIMKTDPDWVNRPAGPLRLPPLIAVTHSSLLVLPAFREALHRCARLLLQSGADPNQSIGSRWPPSSVEKPSAEHQLSALYGAAGQNHDPDLTRLLLQAGADPNDGESLYHSLEHLGCTRLLLDAGARIAGSNAMYRVLDLDDLAALQLLLSAGGNPNEPALTSPPTRDLGSPLLWAIRRRRSPAHIEALLAAGADARARTPRGVSAYRLALQSGMAEVAELLKSAGAAEELSLQDQFIAACASGAEDKARHILSKHPALLASLPAAELRLLPDLVEAGATVAVKTMVRLGWPLTVKGGDWQATPLNLAVFRGDPELTRFLLEHGASWTEKHGFGDDVCGTLSWASCNEPSLGGDWLGCAQALVEHGMPGARPDPDEPGYVIIDGRRRRYSDEVTDFLVSTQPSM